MPNDGKPRPLEEADFTPEATEQAELKVRAELAELRDVRRSAAQHYWRAFPEQRSALKDAYDEKIGELCALHKCRDENALRTFARKKYDFWNARWDSDGNLNRQPTGAVSELLVVFAQTEQFDFDAVLEGQLFHHPRIARFDEASALLAIPLEEMARRIPPVTVNWTTDRVVESKGAKKIAVADPDPDLRRGRARRVRAAELGESVFRRRHRPEDARIFIHGGGAVPVDDPALASEPVRRALEQYCDALNERDLDAETELLELRRRLTSTYWAARSRSATPASPQRLSWPLVIPQPTFEEARRLARGLALGPRGDGWREDPQEIALIHDENNRARYNLRLEGALIPEWWGRPNDRSSLMLELQKIGPHATAILLICVGLIVTSATGHVDFDIDDLLARCGINPRSSRERLGRRYEAWRVLTLIGATRVVGDRRKKIYDRTTRRHIEIESRDPLLTASPWLEVGTQISFDSADPPYRVSASAGRLLDEWRGNPTALQYFGDVIAVSSIPSGQPSGEWARAAGFTLQQLWREQASRMTLGRTGDMHRPTARFRQFTRRELLGMYPPQQTLEEVLASKNPHRAIKYWNDCVKELRTRGILGHYGAGRDWEKDRPRKGWQQQFADEPLDCRPPAQGLEALTGIANAAKAQRERRRRAEPPESPSL